MLTLTLEETSTLMSLDHIGLIAGEGKFPILLARAARERQIHVTAIGITGITSPALENEVDSMQWVDFGKFNRLIEICHQAGIQKAVMAGRIHHNTIFQISKIDWRGMRMLARAASRKADAILGAVTDELARENIEVIDSTLLLRECLTPTGLLTPACPPSDETLEDIEFGRPLAHGIAGLDVGQTIVVKHKSVVAVEAMEGTDMTILRAGEVAGEGCVVIKIQKPRQDRRFDVPVVGMTTIRRMIEARCSALAIPGGGALFFDREEACTLAEAHGISIVAW